MVGANVVSALAQRSTAALLLTGVAELWHLVALAARERRVVRVLLPRVGRDRPADGAGALLQQANALLRLSMNTTKIGGGRGRRACSSRRSAPAGRSPSTPRTYLAAAALFSR